MYPKGYNLIGCAGDNRFTDIARYADNSVAELSR